MKKIATRAELSVLSGAVRKQENPAARVVIEREADPNILAVQEQVNAIANAVAKITLALQAQADMHRAHMEKMMAEPGSESADETMEAVIKRNSEGKMSSVIITMKRAKT